MATKATNARSKSWERAFSKYIELTHSLNQAQDPQDAENIQKNLAKQQDVLMDLRAPSLAAVLQKLYVLWGETDLHGLDQDSEEKRLLLEDFEELLAVVGARPELPLILPPVIRTLPH